VPVRLMSVIKDSRYISLESPSKEDLYNCIIEFNWVEFSKFTVEYEKNLFSLRIVP